VFVHYYGTVIGIHFPDFNSQQTAMMISLMGLMLPVIILSGFIFPLSSMPMPLQIISNIPAKWFIIILKAIMLKGASLSSGRNTYSVGAGVFFIALSIKNKRNKRIK
jgi:ABC-2 type transport system permease protein